MAIRKKNTADARRAQGWVSERNYNYDIGQAGEDGQVLV